MNKLSTNETYEPHFDLTSSAANKSNTTHETRNNMITLTNNDVGFDNALLQYAETLGLGEIHMKMDPATGLRAIVAIHSTKRGPAFGGCRCIEYHNLQEALYDAMRLARGMSYKSAICDLPHGGGKAVLIRPKKIQNREAYFESFGRFVHDLGGRYITAVDSGTNVSDMDIIARQTPYVSCCSLPNGAPNDPSPYTALGVRRGIQAAVKFKLGKSDLENIHVTIQGLGHVGYSLSKELHDLGAKLTVCDINTEATQRCQDEFHATVVDLEAIYSVACDVYAPCALGATLNDKTIPLLNTKIVAGSANNQLAEPRHGQLLQTRDILYAPDYVINAGGLIQAVAQYHQHTDDQIIDRIEQTIYHTLMTIFERAKQEDLATSDIADIMAAARL